jgi:hypothetical protein
VTAFRGRGRRRSGRRGRGRGERPSTVFGFGLVAAFDRGWVALIETGGRVGGIVDGFGKDWGAEVFEPEFGLVDEGVR